jgi:hypothetical protein
MSSLKSSYRLPFLRRSLAILAAVFLPTFLLALEEEAALVRLLYLDRLGAGVVGVLVAERLRPGVALLVPRAALPASLRRLLTSLMRLPFSLALS